MELRSVEISAEDKEKALKEGACQLGVPEDNLAASSLGSGHFLVSVKGLPGSFEIITKPDKMTAVLKKLTPPNGDGNPVTESDIIKKLAELKIVFGINNDLIKKHTDEVAKNRSPCFNIKIAEGKVPLHGKERVIDLKFGDNAANQDAAFIVKKGQKVAFKSELDEGSEGQNIFGEKIPARPGMDHTPLAGLNIQVSKDGLTYTAEVYGKISIDDNKISVFSMLELADDHMSAHMPIYPILADNSRLGLEDVLKTLKNAGVVYGIQEKAIVKALAIEPPQPTLDLQIAMGTKPLNGINASLKFFFSLNGQNPLLIARARTNGVIAEENIVKHLVFSQDLLVKKVSPVSPVDGHSVTGDLIAGSEPADIQIQAGKNVIILEDGLTYAVRWGCIAGYADFKNGIISVEDPVVISKDNMQVLMSIYPPTQLRKSLTEELIVKLINDQEIVHGCNIKAIKHALAEVEKNNRPQLGIIIGQGTPPIKGEDARIDFYVNIEHKAGVESGEDEKIDFRERGFFNSVKQDEVLARKIPATQGKEGCDVLGKKIKAQPGEDKSLKADENVLVSDDGLVYTAEISGVVSVYEGDKIAVSQHYEIKGDVDYSTGNLDMEGSLEIKGWVRTGFKVKATGDIVIHGGVEDAMVESKGNITVKKGVLGAGHGKLMALHDISASFVEEAYLNSGGDIFVKDVIMRSKVICGGNLSVTGGKGNIRGGRLSAMNGAVVNTIGSTAGVKTFIMAGFDLICHKRFLKATQKMKDYQRCKAKIDKILLAAKGAARNKSMSKDVSIKLMLLAKKRRDVVRLEARNNSSRQEACNKLSAIDLTKVKVQVKKAVYAGTTVAIGKYLLNIKDDILTPATFVLNKRGQVVYLKK